MSLFRIRNRAFNTADARLESARQDLDRALVELNLAAAESADQAGVIGQNIDRLLARQSELVTARRRALDLFRNITRAVEGSA